MESKQINGGCTLWARQTTESDIFYNKPDKWFKIWFYIVNKVNHSDTKHFKRGEGFFKYAWIMDYTTASKDQVKHCIEYLKHATMIATRKATRGFYITVLNYDTYQTLDSYKSHTPRQKKAIQKPHRSHTINKNVINGINDKEEEKELTPEIIPHKDINPADIELTQLLIQLMEKNNPGSHIIRNLKKKKQLQADWINDCRLLRVVDKGHSVEDIRRVIEFSQSNDFWKKTAHSMASIRRNWDTLYMKSKPKPTVKEQSDAWANKEER